MTNAEAKFLERVPHILAEIARQLKVANELKALEMKINPGIIAIHKDVDAVMKGDRND